MFTNEHIGQTCQVNAGIHAAGHANRLVLEQGISFREAYQRVGRELKGEGKS